MPARPRSAAASRQIGQAVQRLAGRCRNDCISERKVRGPTLSDRISRSQSIRCASFSRLRWFSGYPPPAAQCGGSFARVGAWRTTSDAAGQDCSRKTRVPARSAGSDAVVHHGWGSWDRPQIVPDSLVHGAAYAFAPILPSLPATRRRMFSRCVNHNSSVSTANSTASCGCPSHHNSSGVAKTRDQR